MATDSNSLWQSRRSNGDVPLWFQPPRPPALWGFLYSGIQSVTVNTCRIHVTKMNNVRKRSPTEDGLQKPMKTENRSDLKCGLGKWTPDYLQRFANSRWFILCHGLLGTLQSMASIYFAGTMTTIERRFGIQTKTSGWMLSGNEISQILMSPILSYFGGQSNRPLWIAWGVFISGLSCFVLATPHFFFGAGPDALSYTLEYGCSNQSYQSTADHEKIQEKGLCTAEEKPLDCQQREGVILAPLLIFLSQFILGVGNTLYYSLGQPYIDDNASRKSSPKLIGTSMAIKTIGALLGSVLVYLCLTVYIDPMATPTIQSTDLRWQGAWWLGWVILGVLMTAVSASISLFPKRLRRPEEFETRRPLKNAEDCPPNLVKGTPNESDGLTKNVEENIQKNLPFSVKDFGPRLVKLLKNKLLVVNIFSGVFYMLSEMAYVSFMTKIWQVPLLQDAAYSNALAIPFVIVAMMAGFITSGCVISFFKPRTTYVLGWNVFVGVISVICQGLFIFLGCSDVEYAGFNHTTREFQLINDCNQGCSCENLLFSPVCHNESQLTYFSPCHAGCTHSVREGLHNMFTNCSCVTVQPDYNLSNRWSSLQYEEVEYQFNSETVMDGYCMPDCSKNLIIFLINSLIMNVLGITGKVGNALLNYRIVDTEDKSFSTGISIFAISLFAFIPCPVIFGSIIDATCLLWDTRCGSKGSCLLYDKWLFSVYFNGTAALITATGVVLDVIVLYLGKNVDLY